MNASLSGTIAVPLCMPMCFVDMLSHSSAVFAIHIVSDTIYGLHCQNSRTVFALSLSVVKSSSLVLKLVLSGANVSIFPKL